MPQSAKKAYKGGSGDKGTMEKKKKAVERLMEQLNKLETQQVDKEENKTIALGTSKLNYLDPRISVTWCKKFDVGMEHSEKSSGTRDQNGSQLISGGGV